MKTRLFDLSVIIFCLLLSYSSLNAQGNIDQVKSKIKQLNEQWANYEKAGNYQAVLDLYADDAIVLPQNAKMIRGKEAFKTFYEERNKDIERYTDEVFNTVDVMGENNLYVEIGTYKYTIQMKNMNNPVNDEGKYVTVWKMMPDGSLKVMVDIANSDKSLKEIQSARTDENKKDNEETGGREKK